MFTIKTTDGFDTWLDRLRDKKAQRRIVARIRKISFGLFGDTKPVGEGVLEAREHFGPGYRIYFTRRKKTLIVILAGGKKSRTYLKIPRESRCSAQSSQARREAPLRQVSLAQRGEVQCDSRGYRQAD